LHIIGKGPQLDEVRAWSSRHENVQLTVDPSRARIHEAYRRSESVVLLSQRVGAWREQVGLPIVEGLAHGCRIVTTDETGLADWLDSHGHTVIAWPNDAESTRRALDRSMRTLLTPDQIRASLPRLDQRAAADHWMFQLTSAVPED